MRITRNLERRIRKAIDLCLDVFVYCPSRGIKYVFLVSLCVCVCVYAVCTRRNTFFWLVLEEEERGIICNSVAAAVGRFCCSFWSLYGISHSAVKGKWAGFFNFASSSVFFFHQRLGQRSRIKRKRPPSSAHPPLFRVCGFIGHLAGWPHL